MIPKGQDDPVKPDTVRITLKVFGGLREMRKASAEEYVVPASATIGDLWAKLAAESPDFAAKLRDGIASGYLNALLNGRNISLLAKDQTKLSNGDVLVVTPPVGGG